MTGIYQCFCASKYSKRTGTFCIGYQVFEHRQIITGMIIGIVNNLLAFIVQKSAEKIDFAKQINRLRFVMINIFVLTFLNLSLIQVFVFND